ncbi:EamA family transporter [Enterococcus sp. BWR-S5]|uniref:EamA family transporter n=1 Tax=Enterococcus sp. BWR-S5 TaxID=2787714 RepID=UPI001922B165|nr:EamA family transporter [Enterococcus sp. BWR-S5]MBL1226724.1 EamA family transporter [Enterococcus sp. BWR-S5]
MWFLPAVITVLAWGTADLFYKKGNNPKDRFTATKTTIMVGLVMGLHVLFYYVMYEGIAYDWKNLLLYLPVSSMYILSMAVGYFGLRYIEVSISSPISNSSGAVSALLTFFLLGGTMNGMQFAAVAIISFGILLLSVFEKQEFDRELKEEGQVIERKYRIGAAAIIFPILYSLIDGLGTFLDGYYLEFKQIMPEDQANMSYELTFFIIALVLWAYLELVKKEPVLVFSERDKGLAALFETVGQFFYVGAIASNAIVVAPMIASYSIVSVLLGRIFLKEKLSGKQYAVILIIMIGIAILGFYDG